MIARRYWERDERSPEPISPAKGNPHLTLAPLVPTLGRWRHGSRMGYDRGGSSNRGSGSACREARAVQKEGGLAQWQNL